MATTIRAHIRNGRIEPVEAVNLPEGTEVEVVIPGEPGDMEAFWSSFGSWKGLLDFDAFEAGRQESRKLSRAAPQL